MIYLKISIGIFFSLLASRLIPHPPNFTSLIALSFYVPAVLGTKFIPVVLISFAITDAFLGFHSNLLFGWISVVIIGLIAQFFKFSLFQRCGGAFIGAWIFYFLSNFGVWINGMYGYSMNGLLLSYEMAIPFFYNTLVSTLIYSILIEIVIKVSKKNNFLSLYKNFFYKIG